MLLVIVDHCFKSLWPLFDYLEVPAFFIISGLLLSARGSLGSFIINKGKRLIPPYIIYELAFIAICGWMLGIDWTAKQLAYYMIAPLNIPLWFLKALFIALVVERVLIACRAFSTLAGSIAVLAVQIAAALLVSGRFEEGYIALSGIPQATVALPLMTMGYMVRCHHLLPRFLALPRRVLLSVALVVIVAAVAVLRGAIHMHQGYIGQQPWLFYPFAFMISAAFLALIVAARRLPLLEYMGVNSLPIFCAHMIPIAFLELRGVTSPWVLFAVDVPLVLLYVAALNAIRGTRKAKP